MKNGLLIERTSFALVQMIHMLLKGYRLYQNTINQEIQIGTVSFEDNKIEIARGVCNYLANNNPETSNYTIGWHPNFKKLFI